MRIAEEAHQDVLVVGGEDHRVGMRPKSYYDAWGRLETWARARFPQAQDTLTKWSGMVRACFEPSVRAAESFRGPIGALGPLKVNAHAY